MKNLPIGIQSIREVLTKDHVYADKTGYAKNLIDKGKHYFMSRPRRFGKSLFLDTLREIFKGNKELFRECQIYNSGYQWQEYPIIYLDFSKIANTTPDILEISLQETLQDIAHSYDEFLSGATSLSQLNRLTTSLAKRSPVVILIDEYDKPIIDHLDNLDVAQRNRERLKSFFGALKGLDTELRFTFTTGVSKFSQVSLFSGYNNLKDITMDPRYAAMMGYTEEELKGNFPEHIKAIVQHRGQQWSQEVERAILEEIRTWYNGYRFSRADIYVYNPFSTLNFMDEKEAMSYWYSTGTPSFLIDQVKKHPQSVVSLSGISALKSTLSDISRLDRINLAALMFQTGYLTIRGYNREENSYKLDFPNKEVKEAFFNSLLQDFAEVNPLDVSHAAKNVRESLEDYDLNAFFKIMNVHFAKIPYPVFTQAKEGFYQAVFFTFLEKSGIITTAEMSTNIGRIDLSCELEKVVCIFEFKLDKTAEIAFDQAEVKKYKERYSLNRKDILIIGVNFSSKYHNISDWKGKLLSESGEFIREILSKKES